jgi:hypothetical protein
MVRAEHVRSGRQAADRYEAGLCRADIQAHGNVSVERVRMIATGPVMRLRSVWEPGRVFNSQLALGLYKGLFNIIQFTRSQLTVTGLLNIFDRPETVKSTDHSSIPLYVRIDVRGNVRTASRTLSVSYRDISAPG